MSAAKKKTGRPPGQTYDVPIHLRMGSDLVERLDALAARMSAAGLSRSAVARLCIQLGLELAERDPRELLAPKSMKGKLR